GESAKPYTPPAMAKTRSTKAAKDAPGVDELLERLEGVVTQLEQGDLPLEGALAQFEEGIALVRRSETLLSGIEQRVEMLLSEGAEGDERVAFDVNEDLGDDEG